MPSVFLNRLAAALPAIEDYNKPPNSSTRSGVSLATELKRWKFALALPVIDACILPTYAQACPQCQQPYNTDFEVAGRKLGHEAPAVLPCSCVIGFHCARQWLSPHEYGYTSCPLCEQEFPDMTEEKEADFQMTSDFAQMNLSDDFSEVIPTQKEIEEEEEMAQLTRHFPSIEEVLMAGPSTLAEKPEIFVISPEGDTLANHEAENGKHIPGADTAIDFTREAMNAPKQAYSKSEKLKTKSLGLAVAAIKAADLIAKRSGA